MLSVCASAYARLLGLVLNLRLYINVPKFVDCVCLGLTMNKICLRFFCPSSSTSSSSSSSLYGYVTLHKPSSCSSTHPPFIEVKPIIGYNRHSKASGAAYLHASCFLTRNHVYSHFNTCHIVPRKSRASIPLGNNLQIRRHRSIFTMNHPRLLTISIKVQLHRPTSRIGRISVESMQPPGVELRKRPIGLAEAAQAP